MQYAKVNDQMELPRNRLEQPEENNLKVLGPTTTKSCQSFIAEVRSQMTKAKHR